MPKTFTSVVLPSFHSAGACDQNALQKKRHQTGPVHLQPRLQSCFVVILLTLLVVILWFFFCFFFCVLLSSHPLSSEVALAGSYCKWESVVNRLASNNKGGGDNVDFVSVWWASTEHKQSPEANTVETSASDWTLTKHNCALREQLSLRLVRAYCFAYWE